MRATGIVRRIDDLGRVVIPKEIRRSMNIKEGDPLEIYVDPTEKTVCFKKYDTYDNTVVERVKAIVNSCREHCIVFDVDCEVVCHNGSQLKKPNYEEVQNDNSYAVYPITCEGETIGELAISKSVCGEVAGFISKCIVNIMKECGAV